MYALRPFVRALSLVGVVAALACSAPQAPSADSGALVRSEPSGLQPKRGGVFHVPVSGNNPNLNPYNVSGAPLNLFNTIYEPLVAREVRPGVNWQENPQIVPWLVERWEQRDPNTYVFQLRKGVAWHDGQPFTAADVVHTIEFLKQNRGKFLDAGRVENIASVQATGADTVTVITSKANPDFLKDDLLEMEIVPKHVAEQGKLETAAIGTGPFRLKQFDSVTGWTVTRNDNYRTKDLPYLDGVAGHYLSDRGAMTAGFAAGSLDVMNPEDKVQFETVQGIKPDLKFERFYGNYGFGLYFAMDQPPFNDIRVRRAMNLAVDRQDMIVKAAFGDGIVNPPGTYAWRKGWSMPQEDLLKLPGYNPSTRQRDIEEAKRLLAEAGYPNGLSAKISYSGASTNPKPIAEVITSQLRPLGLNFTLVPLDRATRAQAERDEAYELYILGMRGDNRSEIQERFHSKGALNKKGPKDPELDAIIDKLQVEFDDGKARQLHQQYQRRLYDQAYFLGAFERASYTVYQPWVHDVLNNYGANIIPYYTPPQLWMDVDQMPANRKAEKP